MRHIPKAELHVHLEGSIDAETLMAIDPSMTRDEFLARTSGTNFAAFLEGYKWVTMRLREPEHYAIATRNLTRGLEEQGVTYAEVTLSAGVVLWKGQELGAVYDAIWSESQRANITVLWILDAVRHFGAEHAMEVARFAVERRGEGVIAFGIGGDEIRGPAHWFRESFAYARNAGLHLVAHAGEASGPESIWAALEIGAERIGHGATAVQDDRLLQELRTRDIPLEVCITSNVCTGVVPSLDRHPVRRAYDAGVPITINTDDPALFKTTLEREYEIAEEFYGLPARELAANSFRYAFGYNSA